MFVIMMFLAVISHAQEVIAPVSVSASDHYENYIPENVLDGDIKTTWRAFGRDHWIQLDLGSEQAFNSLRIQWHAGHLRKANFRVEISSNGVDFTDVWDDISSGTTKYFEEYLIMDHMARYVRLIVQGNNKNDWNSIADIQVVNTPYPNTVWSPSELTASGWQEPNIPWNIQDWMPDTRWSANGKGQWIQYSYLVEVEIREVEILWYQPTKSRRMTFVIETKAEGDSTWKVVFKGQSSGSNGYETYIFNEVRPISHLRVTGFGNTLNDWISISEMHAWSYEEPRDE